MTVNDIASLHVEISGFGSGQPIPETFASCAPDGNGTSRKSSNINPAIVWSGAPASTQSYAIIVVDKDVPVNFDSANRKGIILPVEMPRTDFYHWVVINIPAAITSLKQNTSPVGLTGRNSFGSHSRSANGYDGPCPPWNDERLHHYHFRVYALDKAFIDLTTPFTGEQAELAMNGHVLASGEVIGTYTTNLKRNAA